MRLRLLVSFIWELWSRGDVDDDELELLINSYFNITRRTMIDMVPKAIMLTLVQYDYPFPSPFSLQRRR